MANRELEARDMQIFVRGADENVVMIDREEAPVAMLEEAQPAMLEEAPPAVLEEAAPQVGPVPRLPPVNQPMRLGNILGELRGNVPMGRAILRTLLRLRVRYHQVHHEHQERVQEAELEERPPSLRARAKAMMGRLRRRKIGCLGGGN